jgi:hypothetical protein
MFAPTTCSGGQLQSDMAFGHLGPVVRKPGKKYLTLSPHPPIEESRGI